jgi:hypothetical protein
MVCSTDVPVAAFTGFDTPPIAIACTGCGGAAGHACPRGYYCTERARAAAALDIELAVDLLPGGIPACNAVIARGIGGPRKRVVCGERIPWFTLACPNCNTPAPQITMPEPARRRIVQALAKELEGPTGVPLFGGVLHHLSAWAFRAIRLYLTILLQDGSLHARVELRKMRAPRTATPLFDVIDQMMIDRDFEFRTAKYGKETWREKPDSRPDRVPSNAADVAFYRRVLRPESGGSVLESIHALPCTAYTDSL